MDDSAAPLAFRHLLSGLLRAPLRFPVTLACALGWAAVTIAREHGIESLTWDIVQHWQVFLIGGLFLSLAATLFAEGRGWGRLLSLGLALGGLALAALVAYLGYNSDPWESPGFYLLVPGGILLMIVAPFLRRGSDDQEVWDFNLASWLSVLFGLIVAVGLGLGTMAVLGGLETLFGLHIASRLYEDTWIVCMSLIWPWQTLAGIPGQRDERADTAPPRWTAYVVSWLLIPLALIYLLLLYGFATKVLATWELPRGTVGWLVGGFAAFGLAVWSAAWPFRETGNRLVRLYHRFFHYALVVPVTLLAIGVGVRIAEYGVTEKRYALILLTLWLGGIALYGIMARPARIAVAPAAFAAMLIAGAIGPWGATSVSVRSQLARLDAMLVEAGVLRDGKLSPADGSADRGLMQKISGVVDYLNDRSRRQLLVVHLRDRGIDLADRSSSTEVIAALGMDYVNRRGNTGYQSWSRSEPDVLSVHGFDAVLRMKFDSRSRQEKYAEIAGSRIPVTFMYNNDETLEISAGDNGPVTINLAEIAKALERDGAFGYDDSANGPLMAAKASGNGLRVHIHITSISGYILANGPNISNVAFIALIGLDEDS